MSMTRATITNLDANEQFEVLFNPTDYTIAKTNTWQAKPVVGKNVPKLDFTGGGSRTLNMELLFDTFEAKDQDVRPQVDKLWRLTMIDESNRSQSSQRSRPPSCLFQWGGSWSFRAVVTSLSVRYTLFTAEGTPVRAMATVSFEECRDDNDQPGTNPTSFAEGGMRRREVRPDDTLALIAFEEYGDSGKWRSIAEANRISDPRQIEPGQLLAIPSLS